MQTMEEVFYPGEAEPTQVRSNHKPPRDPFATQCGLNLACLLFDDQQSIVLSQYRRARAGGPGLFPGGVPGPADVVNLSLLASHSTSDPLQRRFRARARGDSNAATVTVRVYIEHALPSGGRVDI